MKRAQNNFDQKEFIGKFNAKADSIFANFISQIQLISPNKIDLQKLKSVTSGGSTLYEHEKSGNIVILLNGPRQARIDNIYDGQKILKSAVKSIIDAGFVVQETTEGLNISLPQITEEVRKNLFKEVKSIKEDAKQRINKLRAEIDKELKGLTGLSEDVQRMTKNEIDKSKDLYHSKMEKETALKEVELKG